MMLTYLYVFGRAVPMYGVMVILGAAASLLYVKLCEKKQNFPEADTELALVYCVIGIFNGAKLLWLATIWPEFLHELPYLFTMPQAFLQKYLSGGFVFYGGMFGAVLSAWLYCRINRLPFWELTRSLMPVAPLFHAFGRLGCFCMGCCYGCESEIFGIVYNCSEIAPNGVSLVPVQLIAAFGEFLLFFLLASLVRKRGSGKMVFSVWMLSYGVLRFVLEFFRADDYRGFLGSLSLSQTISLIAVAWALLLLLPNRKRKISKQ